MKKPNVLFIMCDQLRADSIAVMGNGIVKTPNIDRLAKRGYMFTNAYSTCPVCIPARYTIRTGCEPYNTGIYMNALVAHLANTQAKDFEDRCGKYLARTMSQAGYRTFGIGKFHSVPWNEDLGFETHMYSEEIMSPKQRLLDNYAKYLSDNHPEYDHIEQLHGERTDMYYMPQTSPMPADITVEGWAAAQAVNQINKEDNRPYFGLVSFIGPHPPFSPPIPYNRMYDPDKMPNPVKGDIHTDHMDETLPWMNYCIWADEINDFLARSLKARYYGEITYIDDCIGRILDAVEKRPDADDTLICFFSDHGDHLGDHHSWQKESFFEASCKVPFLVSWPSKINKEQTSDDLVCLTDLFGIATHASGKTQTRDGVDVLGTILDGVPAREYLYGIYQIPGECGFKLMIRHKEWKYIFLSNGGREQLFDLDTDPNELNNLAYKELEIIDGFRKKAVEKMDQHAPLKDALCGDKMRSFEYTKWERVRIHQFEVSKGVTDYMY